MARGIEDELIFFHTARSKSVHFAACLDRKEAAHAKLQSFYCKVVSASSSKQFTGLGITIDRVKIWLHCSCETCRQSHTVACFFWGQSSRNHMKWFRPHRPHTMGLWLWCGPQLWKIIPPDIECMKSHTQLCRAPSIPSVSWDPVLQATGRSQGLGTLASEGTWKAILVGKTT